MGSSSSKSLFRSKLYKSLIKEDFQNLSLKTNIKCEDIEQCYLRFLNCYPYGYLKRRDFVKYFQEFRDEFNSELKLLIKELFDLFDLNKDNKLDFIEFFLFNILINDSSIDNKLKLIFQLYNNKQILFLRNQLKDFLRNLFDLFNIPSSKLNIIYVINIIYKKNNMKKYEKIQWNKFTHEILNDENLLKQLISLDFYQDEHDEENEQEYSYYQPIIQRSERF